MSKKLLLLFTIFISFTLQGQDIAGQWNGIINYQGTQQRVVVNIIKKDNAYSATIINPDQGLKALPVDSINFKDSVLQFKVNKLNIEYEGKLNQENNIIGNLKERYRTFSLTLSQKIIEKEKSQNSSHSSEGKLGNGVNHYGSPYTPEENKPSFIAISNGIKFSLLGRAVTKKPNLSDTLKGVGTVVVNIVVDRAGNVIKALAGARGTTTLNAAKLLAAKNAALSTQFSTKPDGPAEQNGMMTFNFNLE